MRWRALAIGILLTVTAVVFWRNRQGNVTRQPSVVMRPEDFTKLYGAPEAETASPEKRILLYRKKGVTVLFAAKSGAISYEDGAGTPITAELAGERLQGFKSDPQPISEQEQSEQLRRGCQVTELTIGNRPMADISPNELALLNHCHALGY